MANGKTIDCWMRLILFFTHLHLNSCVFCRSERNLLVSAWVHWDRVHWPASRNASAPGVRSAWQRRRATAFLPVLGILSETSCLRLLVQRGRQHRGAVPEQDFGGERFCLSLWALHHQWDTLWHIYVYVSICVATFSYLGLTNTIHFLYILPHCNLVCYLNLFALSILAVFWLLLLLNFFEFTYFCLS